MQLQEINEHYRDEVNRILREQWHCPPSVSKGKVIDTTTLPGFLYMEEERIKGVATYQVEDLECEIVTLNSFEENRGIGTAMIKRILEVARKSGCRRVWLITTNDDVHAIRFYQRQGFELVAAHINAMEHSRMLKPSIPHIGMDDIPIKHELEFEILLKMGIEKQIGRAVLGGVSMKKTYTRPTSHYDSRVERIDEELCRLIQQRRILSENNPGFPTDERIAEWSLKYGIYEDLLKSLFGSLWHEDNFKPVVEPKGYLGQLKIMKAVESGDRLYSILSIRQYENASVVNLSIDWNDPEESMRPHPNPEHHELTINDRYDCRMVQGSGGNGHQHYRFVVSPALPEDPTGMVFTLKQFTLPRSEDSAGEEITIVL